jgi:putative polyhydroxyalkanoate system protein
MSVISVQRGHERGLNAAKEEAELIAQDLSKKFGMNYRWEYHELSFKGSGAKGKMECYETSLSIRLELGFMLRPFKSKIESEIHKYLDEFCG